MEAEIKMVAELVNSSGTIGMIINSATTSFTGSLGATMFIVLAVLIALSIMLSIPLEFMAVILFPLCIAVASYESSFLAPVIVIIIYVSVLIAKNWLIR
jgi:hypothetical protein